MGRLWKELTQQNARPAKAMMGINPLADQAFLDTAGDVPNGAIYAAVPGTVVQTAPEAEQVAKLSPGETLGLFGLEGATSAAILVEALRATGRDLSRESLMHLLSTDFGPIKLPFAGTAKSAPNNLLIQESGIATVKDGKFAPAMSGFA